MTETADITEQIIHDAVETERERAGRTPETMGEFTKNVKENGRATVQNIADATGADVSGIMGDVMQKAESYAAAKQRIVDSDFEIGDTMSKGAAGWNDKGDNSIRIDDDAMAYDGPHNAAYWARVSEHEKIHRDKQAAQYNASTLMIRDGGKEEVVDVVGTLTEAQATQVNASSDLTPEYLEHQAAWPRITRIVNESRLEAALLSGDIVSLQEEIDAKAPAERPELVLAA